MFLIFYIFIFLFGLCIGSFLNCVIYRTELQENMPKGSPQRKVLSSLRGRSFCPKCKEQLRWQDLIPIFSFLFLRGKCRYCHKKVSIQYPLIELITGLLFLLIFDHSTERFALVLGQNTQGLEHFGFLALSLGFLFYIVSSFIIIFVYDLKHYIIPDKVLFPAIIITFLYRLFENLKINSLIGNWKLKIENFATISNFLLAALIAAGFFFAIFLISNGKWIGFGDVKLAILMGFFLGLPNVLAALFLAFFFGAIISIMLMVFGKKGLKSEIPFGPFLIAGTFIATLWGKEIIQWYFNLFNF
ncbi:MAG: leader peptidase (prepilin peptidase) / N-methyltransferase [Parcubacteria group bacterium Licking1014_1]|nr:MAG: leader peptidase (prepilin peptidase) / N-methyltransferase [Parcubacteria group bacterium Licking1014_1]